MTASGRTSATRTHLLALALVTGAATACVLAEPGAPGGGGGKQATYETLTLQVISPPPGQALYPGGEILYELDYRGALANPPSFAALVTDEGTGAVTRIPTGVEGSQQDTTFRTRKRWQVRHPVFKQAGRFRVDLQATVQPTLRGSDAFVVTAAPLFMQLATSVDAVRVVAPANPVAYGTPVDIQVDGRDLWDDIVLTAVDAAGAPVPALEARVPFGLGDRTIRHSWIISARALERVGSHDIHLVASYGALSARSGPLTLVLTHTIDTASVLVRRLDGTVTPGTGLELRLQNVKELVVRARGTQLAGHEVTVNGGKPFVAASDEVEIAHPVSDRDFEAGEAQRRYEFSFRSGGVERTASETLVRWGITSCGWFDAAGQPLADGAEVKEGTPVIMRATTWGFPDTRTTLGIFKDREANFAIKESDAGRHPILGPGDDDVDDFDADIRGDASEHGWTARHDEDTPLPVPLVRSYAELFFDVTIEDQTCRSKVMRVPTVVLP
jgi:hypothetical protein